MWLFAQRSPTRSSQHSRPPPPSATERAHDDAIRALHDESARKRAATPSGIDVAAAAAVAAQAVPPPAAVAPPPEAPPPLPPPAAAVAAAARGSAAVAAAATALVPSVPAHATSAPEDEEPADATATPKPAGDAADTAELPARKKAKGLVLRAEAKIRARDHEGARRLLIRAAALDPTFADGWRDLGIVRATLGDAKGARLAYRKYLAVAPDAPDAAEVRRILHEGAGKP